MLKHSPSNGNCAHKITLEKLYANSLVSIKNLVTLPFEYDSKSQFLKFISLRHCTTGDKTFQNAYMRNAHSTTTKTNTMSTCAFLLSFCFLFYNVMTACIQLSLSSIHFRSVEPLSVRHAHSCGCAIVCFQLHTHMCECVHVCVSLSVCDNNLIIHFGSCQLEMCHIHIMFSSVCVCERAFAICAPILFVSIQNLLFGVQTSQDFESDRCILRTVISFRQIGIAQSTPCSSFLINIYGVRQ